MNSPKISKKVLFTCILFCIFSLILQNESLKVLAAEQPLFAESLAEEEKPTDEIIIDPNLYKTVLEKSFITVNQDPWEKANINLLQVKHYWEKELTLNPKQGKNIETFLSLNTALQAYLMGSYNLDKVSPPNYKKARDLFDYSLDILNQIQSDLVSWDQSLGTTITRFIDSLKKEIKSINDIIEPR